MMKIRRALISVWDKSGLLELAEVLVRHGCELFSTGGTARHLRSAGYPVADIGALTGHSEAFGGRMKSLSFALAASLLFHRERDAEEATALGVLPIDLVVCNFYPFEAAAARGDDLAALVEQVDIGGPMMVRAAAKNHEFVAVATSPAQYAPLASELDSSGGALSRRTRDRLMLEAFHRVADYDASIASAFDARHGVRSLRLSFERGSTLRYGENAHQEAWLFRERNAATSVADIELLGGKPLSYNNMTDLQAALDAVKDLPAPGCAVVKHQNPCGLAMGRSASSLLAAAWDGDPLSAFGGIVAWNRPVDRECVAAFRLDSPDKSQRRLVEVVCAPDFTPDAAAWLRGLESLRIVRFDCASLRAPTVRRHLHGALLAQQTDSVLWERLELVTRARLDSLDEELLAFGVIAARQLRSNAIALVRRRPDGVCQLLGMGCGQPNRVDSTKLALGKAAENLRREGDEAYVSARLSESYLVSDGFFPFADSIEQCAMAGVRNVFQPGGSIRDKAVIRRCDELDIRMVFIGTRHFSH